MVEYLKIRIISGHHIPFGGAQSNRIITYARGLQELGADVKILESIPRSVDSLNTKKKGSVKGVNYNYYNSLDYKKTSVFIKGIKFLLANLCVLGTLFLLRFLSSKPRVIIQENRVVFRFSLVLLCRIFFIKVFRDISEYPNHLLLNNLSMSGKIKSWMNFIIELYMFNGLIFMTFNIRDYFFQYRKNIKYIIMPMTVEPDRFKYDGLQSPDKYIAYCGSMYSDKDGVPILIKAFDIVAEKHKDIKLKLVGDTSDKNKFRHIQHKINESNHKERIILTGFVDRSKIPEHLCQATILALSRPANKQAEGGFPTKLGEYLATGRAVIVTDVGEISNYLSDSINAFICSNITPEGFAEKIDFVLSNPTEAERVGVEGKKLSYGIFNYKKQSVKLLEFIKI
jgi:glycosyltransferase involved in cell wall biosynthesis